VRPRNTEPLVLNERLVLNRVVLVHLNVAVPHGDTRDAAVIADAIHDAISVGSDSVRDLEIVVALAEEI
jgi:hypothetical protein